MCPVCALVCALSVKASPLFPTAHSKAAALSMSLLSSSLLIFFYHVPISTAVLWRSKHSKTNSLGACGHPSVRLPCLLWHHGVLEAVLILSCQDQPGQRLCRALESPLCAGCHLVSIPGLAKPSTACCRGRGKPKLELRTLRLVQAVGAAWSLW